MVFIFSLDVPLKLSNALSRPFSHTGDAEIFLRHSYSYLRFAILRASQLRTFFKARNPIMTLSALRLQRCRGRSVGTRVSLEKDTLVPVQTSLLLEKRNIARLQLVMQRFQIGLRIRLFLLVTIGKNLVLTCDDLFCGNLADFQLAKKGQHLRADNMLLRQPGIFF